MTIDWYVLIAPAGAVIMGIAAYAILRWRYTVADRDISSVSSGMTGGRHRGADWNKVPVALQKPIDTP